MDETLILDKYSIWRKLPEALGNDETMSLLEEYKKYGDPKVKEKLINGNLRFVRFYVMKYKRWLCRCQSQIEPDVEDLMQQGVFVLIKTIDKFDMDYKFQFSTYLSRALDNNLSMLKRDKISRLAQNTVSLHDRVFTQSSKGDRELEIMDTLGDNFKLIEDIETKMTVDEFNKILSLLSKRQRDIFLMYYRDKMNVDFVCKKMHISRNSLYHILLPEVCDKIKRIYETGVTDVDLDARGLEIGNVQRDRLARYRKILKNYDRDFLENYLCLKLAPRKREIYKVGILRYYGQSMFELSKQVGTTVSNTFASLDNIEKFIDKNIDKLYKEYKNGEEVKPAKVSDKIVWKINANKKLVDEYGGELFLRKYFVPTLAEREKYIFDQLVLSYYGQSVTSVCKKVGITVSNALTVRERVLEKLRNADFDILVDMIDRTKQNIAAADKISMTHHDKVKKRVELVKKYGGCDFLKEYFLPTLPKGQQIVFKDYYLEPKYDRYDTMAKGTGLTMAFIIKSEKVILEKLATTNVEELRSIQDQVERELNYQKYLANEIDYRGSYKKRVAHRQKILMENGGIEFLRERFVPSLLNADKIIFEKYLVECVSSEKVYEALGFKHKDKSIDGLREDGSYVTMMYRNRILPKLKKFRESFEDFDSEVKQFYMQKGFKDLHGDEFEKVAFAIPEKEKKDEVKIKKTFSDKQIEAWGGKIVIAKKHLPMLRTVVDQLYALNAIVKDIDEKEVIKNIGMEDAPKTEYNNFKLNFVSKMNRLARLNAEDVKKFNDQKAEKDK